MRLPAGIERQAMAEDVVEVLVDDPDGSEAAAAALTGSTALEPVVRRASRMRASDARLVRGDSLGPE